MCCSPSDLFLVKGDFGGSPNCYSNKVMRGLKFRIFLDSDKQLKDEVQWSYLPNGGFSIDIPGFEMQDDTLIIVQFY